MYEKMCSKAGWAESQEEVLFQVLEFAGWFMGLPQNAAQL